MAQKFYAVINRHRNKGRDFYDLVFLMSKDVVPDYNYLDMELMAKDVEPFLFNTSDLEKVVHFDDVLCQYSF
jgi:hypothetical protein